MHSRRIHLLAVAAGLLTLLLAGPPSAAAEEPAIGDARPEAPLSNAAQLQYVSDQEDGWEYDTYYIFPYTRHMPESELPFPAQIALYPFAFIFDLAQAPLGALYGLGGK